jgi:hypothetical protein
MPPTRRLLQGRPAVLDHVTGHFRADHPRAQHRWRSTSRPAVSESNGERLAPSAPLKRPPGLYYVAKVRYFEEL